MRQALRIFQHGVARWITGRQPKRWEEGGREYPPLVSDMEEAGFEEIGDYILKRQNTVTQYIATRLILDLCKKTVRRTGAWVDQRCWEQEGIDLAGVRARAVAAADREDEREGE